MKKALTKEQIEAKKEALMARVKESGETLKAGRISPAKEFLFEIKEIVKSAIDLNIPYTQLSRDIEAIYNIKISVSILRAFAYSVLGVEKKKTNKQSTEKAVKKAVIKDDKQDVTKSDGILTVKEMKEQQSKQNLGDDSL